MGVSSRSRTALPSAEASLEGEAALLVTFQSTPPSARVSNIDGFSWVIDEPVCDRLGRAVFVTENNVFLGDMDFRSRTEESRLRTTKLSPGLAAKEILKLVVTSQSLWTIIYT